MMGALYQHVTAPREGKYTYAPTNVNFGLLPPATIDLHPKDKQGRRRFQIERALADADAWASPRRAARPPGVAA
jgi:folate-dependent tRNA-U54 methylase TrmFO/GidA